MTHKRKTLQKDGGEKAGVPPEVEELERDLPFFEMATSSSGFILRPVPKELITPGTSGWQTVLDPKRTGGTIYYNPLTFTDFPGDARLFKAELAHEAGHHHPFVKRFLVNGMGEDLRMPPLMPQYYDDNSFLAHCHNGLADIVDECVMGRYPFGVLKATLDHKGEAFKLDVEKYRQRTLEALSGENRLMALANLLPSAIQVYHKDDEQVKEQAVAFVERAASEKPPADLEEKASVELKNAFAQIEHVLANWGGSLDGGQEALKKNILAQTVGYLKMWPKPEQYIQLLLQEARYPSGYPLEMRVEPDVLEAYNRTMAQNPGLSVFTENGPAYGKSAMEVLTDTGFFNLTLFQDRYMEAAYQDKVDAYRRVFRAEYMNLVDAEVKQRAESQKQGKSGRGGGGGGGMSSSAPMTRQERKQLIDKLKQAIRDGIEPAEGGGKPIELTEAEWNEISKELKGELDALSEKYKSMSQRTEEEKRRLGQKTGAGQPFPREPDFFERLRQLAGEWGEKDRAGKARGLGEKHGVDAEIIEEYFSIKDRYAGLIRKLTDELTDVFRENRLAILRYNQREGDITPGLEAETLSEFMAGNMEPDTMMRLMENPEFARTQLLDIVDVSGSMDGVRNAACKAMLVVMAETLEGVRDRLEGEAMLRPEDEVPLQMGAGMFDVEYHPVHKLGEPVDDKAKINMIRRLHEVGGGTDDYKSIKPEYEKFKTGDPFYIKILVLMSDAYGDEERMAQLAEDIQKDDTILCLMLGFGADAEKVSQQWGEAARKCGAKNVFAKAFPDSEVEEATPFIVDFFRQQVPPRVEKLTSVFRGY